MERGIKKVLDDLRAARVLVLHPRDEDGDALIRQLRRIGSDVRAAWPIPDMLPKDIDTVFVLVEHAGPEAFPWTVRADGPIVIGVVDYESPTTLKALLDWRAHGVVNKPIRPFGIMSSLVLARNLGSYHARLEVKINKLEDTLRARREVEKAIRILMELKAIGEGEAYRLVREQAQAKRVSIAQIATNIVTGHETLGGLGLDLKRPDGSKAEAQRAAAGERGGK
jgi:AmiR/NasT family two-component response regulator